MPHGLHSFNGPERNFRPLGAPTNPGRRPVASGRKWAIHREYKPERGAHTKVQYNGMKYQKGLKPPPRQLLQEGRRPMTTGFVPRVKTRPATQQASRNFHKLFGGKLERHTSHGRRSKSSSSPRRGRSVKVVSPRQKRATTSPTRRTMSVGVGVLGFDDRSSWGKRSKTPAEIVAEIRRERETALSRKLAGMAHSNETSLGNPMPGASVARRSMLPREPPFGGARFRPHTRW